MIYLKVEKYIIGNRYDQAQALGSLHISDCKRLRACVVKKGEEIK